MISIILVNEPAIMWEEVHSVYKADTSVFLWLLQYALVQYVCGATAQQSPNPNLLSSNLKI